MLKFLLNNKSVAAAFTFNVSRTMASANTNTAALVYPPRIKYENGFLLDQRMGQRKVVGINNEIPYTLIRFELAQVEDRAMLGQFLVDHFNKHCSIFSVLNPTFEDTAPFLYDMLDHLLHKNISIMAFEDNKLIGFTLNSFHTPDEYPELYRGRLFKENPKFEMKDDYGKEIDNGPFPTRKGNQIGTVCGECYWQTGKFLPKDIKNLGATEAVGVLSQYTRSKLFYQMMDISERLFRENDCNYVAAYCAAKATYEYCKKRGYDTIYALPYDEFKDNGNVVFKDLSDNADALYFQLLKL